MGKKILVLAGSARKGGNSGRMAQAVAEKMITIGKNNDLHSKRQVFSYVTKEDVAKKLFDEIAPKYADRNGGYTQIVKIGPRRGDAAEMAIIKLV